MESCEVCGFEWDLLGTTDVPLRLRAAATGFGEVLARWDPERPVARAPGTWSALEYSGHVRDVLFNLRDRIVLGLAEDNPVPKQMYSQVRIDAGLYAADDRSTLTTEIGVAADLLARTVDALTDQQLARPIFYGWPVAATRTLLWVGAQAVHESEHHLADLRALVDG
jgi:hypothetical protein